MKKTRFIAASVGFFLLFLVLFGFILGTLREDSAEKSTLYVEYKGEQLENGASLELSPAEPIRFDIEYELEWLTGARGFHVKIIPLITKETNFTFSYDWYQKAYSDVTSLNVGFDLQAKEDYFTLQVPGDLNEILQKQFPANTISGTPSAFYSGIDYFTIVILSDDQSEQIKINFSIAPDVEEINLGKESIVF